MGTLALPLIASGTALADSFNYSMADGASSAKGIDQATSLFGATGTFSTITNVLLFLIGAISVIMLIVGGIRYVVSGGDSAAVANAKNTILYAIVGVIIAILAYAIINFVISSFTPGGAAATGSAPTNT
jgi:hypothetical protein